MSAPARLPDRPSLTLPAAPREPSWRRQPGLGVAGLALVVPIAALLALGAGGAEHSAAVLGPLATFALPVVAMVGFWWDDWPGTLLRRSWTGWSDTALIVVAAVLLAMLGQAIVAGGELTAVLTGDAEATIPLAAATFVAMLQLTLVTEGWPLRSHLPRLPAGVCALVVSWVVALALYLVVMGVRPFTGDPPAGPLTGPEFGAVLTIAGSWQVWFSVLWRGWPIASMTRRGPRLLLGNAVVIVGTILTYAATSAVAPGTVTMAAGSFVAAGLLVGMQFEGALATRLAPAAERAAVLVATVVLAVVLYAALTYCADALSWPRGWVTHTTLNALGLSTVLHVLIGRRWPFGGAAVS